MAAPMIEEREKLGTSCGPPEVEGGCHANGVTGGIVNVSYTRSNYLPEKLGFYIKSSSYKFATVEGTECHSDVRERLLCEGAY